jgi:hypothetical protein
MNVDHMKRPKAKVLPDSSVVPDCALIQPPPNRFTHALKAEQPYRYAGSKPSAPPDGTLPAGAKVVLLFHDGGPECHVIDGRGLHVVTAFGGLAALDRD